MMYDSWDMKRNRQNFLSFWIVFCPFTPITTRKIKNLKNWRKRQEISSFYTSVPKIMIICYTIPGIWRVTDVSVIFHFGLFFALLPPNSPKIKILKALEISSIYNNCTKNHDYMLYYSPETWHVMDVISFYFGPFSAFYLLTAQKIKL